MSEDEVWRTAYIGLGSNMGDRAALIAEALSRLAASSAIKIIAVSRLHETAPWGVTEQPHFMNAAASIATSLSPESLLDTAQRVESELGRVRVERWGPRTIDIDILHIPGVVMNTSRLTLPHPYMTERAFVLVPLSEIAGDVDVNGKKVREWAELVSINSFTNGRKRFIN